MTPMDVLPHSLADAPPPQWIAAPSPVYLTGEEFLQVSSLANVNALTLTVTGRVLRPDNRISRIAFTHTPNSNRTVATTRVALSEGWLLGLRVVASAGAPAFGAVFCSLELVTGNTGGTLVDQTLGRGFLTANIAMQWPNGPNQLPVDGPGNVRSITGTVPAAGADISETVPTGARWQLIAARATLTTSATVATRSPGFIVDDGANAFLRVYQNSTVAASSAGAFTWGTAWSLFGASVGSEGTQGLPGPLRLAAGFRFRTSTTNLQAADQWTAPQYLVREWMTGE